MRSSKPPALATWLVEHTIPGGRNEALTGDLLEQFSQGRSASWYWRQALVAMLLGFVKQWRVLAWAAVVTMVWAVHYLDDRLFGNTPSIRAFFGVGISRPWLVSLISATTSFALHATQFFFIAGSIYIALRAPDGDSYEWSWRATWQRARLAFRRLGRGYLVLGFSTFLLLAFLPARRHPILVGNIVGLLPMFFGLLVMMWSVPSNGARKGTFKLFRIDPPSNW